MAQQSPPAAGNQGTAPLPEVKVIQEKAKTKASAPKPKKQPPPPQTVAEPAQPQEPVYAVPGPPGDVAVSPLPGSELPVAKIPRAVTGLSSADIKRDGSVIPQDTLNNRIPGVVIDDLQGNAFQTGVNYRGFEASPVNGLPQGLAVYQNGVRINEAFGDTVNWDFLPMNAISDLTVMSSNPIFGLNAIGGSISLTMKDGFSYQGADVDTRFGSFGRKQVSTEAGANSGGFAIYGAFEAIDDDGFRDFSDAEERRGYVDLGVKGDRSEFHFNFTGAKSTVGVTAAVPEELIDFGGRQRTFTSPQITESEMQMYSLNGTVQATNTLTFSGATYYRHFKQSHIDGNISEFNDCSDDPDTPSHTLCTEEGEELFPVGHIGTSIDPSDFGILGSIDKTGQDADSYGGTLQAADKSSLFGHKNLFVVGASYDHGHVNYEASSQLGTFLPKYVVAGTGPTLTGDGESGSEVTPRSLTTLNDYVGIYVVDAFDITDQLTLTLGGRYNYARIEIENDGDPALDDLNGLNEYNRFNPSAGLTYQLTPGISLYGGYAEANRAPTASEIACSDPDNPCIIESALASDPPLKQVVSRTFEIGVRGEQTAWATGDKLEWSLGAFHSLNKDDILQIADSQQGRGYFANAGETKRQGIEASVAYRSQRLFAYASYAYIDATFNSHLIIPSENNPAVSTTCESLLPGFEEEEEEEEDEGPAKCVQIRPGDRLPGVPLHRFKVGFDYKLTPQWTFGADLISASNQIFFGDEGNDNRPLAGYYKINLHSSYDITDNIQIYGLIENLTDQEYGIYGTYFNVDLAQGAAAADPSLNGLEYDENNGRTTTPAIPFAAYGGLKVKF